MIRVIPRLYLSFRSRIDREKLKKRTVWLLKIFESRISKTSAEQLMKSPENGKWNATEVAFHAIKTAKDIFHTCDSLRRGEQIPDPLPSALGRTKSISQDELIAFCRKVQELADQFDYDGSLQSKCSHPWFGKLNFHQWLVLNMVHLERHYNQMKRVIG